MIKILVKHSLVFGAPFLTAKLLNFWPKSKVFPHGVTLNNVNPIIQLIRKKIQLIQSRISCIRSATTAVLQPKSAVFLAPCSMPLAPQPPKRPYS